MKINIKQIALTAGGVALGVVLFRWIKHEYAEMKAEKEPKEPNLLFTADENKFMNYVNEGFMGFTAGDEFMMLGGSKPIEFANASGSNPPVATDEPNFAYAKGSKMFHDKKKNFR